MNNFFLQGLISYLCVYLLIVFPCSAFAGTIVSDPLAVTISAQVNSPTSTTPSSNLGGGGGGGGGGGAGSLSIPTTVNFSGVGYPLSKITILQDGKIVATTVADPAARFSVSVSDLATDTYTFVVYGEDSKNNKSASFSFPIFVTTGTTVSIANIFLSPTVTLDKSEVKQGDNLTIFGATAPLSEVTISVHSAQEAFYNVMSDKAGLYVYMLDTTPLELGKHETKAKARIDQQLSSFSSPFEFLVGSQNKIKKDTQLVARHGDLSGDGRVNLIDFSIMAFWYTRPNPPKNIDLNADGKITLIDFSIMAYNWTG